MTEKQGPNPRSQFDDEIDIIALAAIIFKQWKKIAVFSCIVTLIAVAVTLQMPNIYSSSATLMPINQKSSPGIPSQFAATAAMLGVSSGAMNTNASTINAVLNSTKIKIRLIEHLNLKIELNKKKLDAVSKEERAKILKKITMQDLIVQLGKVISINSDKKSEITSISATLPDRFLAAQIANTMIDELTKILEESSFTMAKKNRVFLEDRVKLAKKELEENEEKLIKFQKMNNILNVASESEKMLESYSSLVSARTKKEIELRTMESSLSPTHPMVTQLKEEISAFNRKISELDNKGFAHTRLTGLSAAPGKALAYLRIRREYEIAEAIYKTLLPQLESSKIEEAKESVYFQVLDRAEPKDANKKLKPKRSIIVMISFFMSLMAGAILALLFDYWKNNSTELRANFK